MKTQVLAIMLLTAVLGFAQRSPKLSSDLVVGRHDKSMVEVIVRYKAAPSARHRSRITARQGTVKTDLSIIRSLHVSLPASRIAELARDKDVEYIAPNRKVGSKLYNTAGAVNAQTAWNLNLDGTGIGVAVIDSGINNVADLKASGTSAIAASFDTLGGGAADLYGHGTHVAGIIAGDGASSTVPTAIFELRGLAPEREPGESSRPGFEWPGHGRVGDSTPSTSAIFLKDFLQHPGLSIYRLGVQSTKATRWILSARPSRQPGKRASWWSSPPVTTDATILPVRTVMERSTRPETIPT
jgi:subtilisin family serine protease